MRRGGPPPTVGGVYEPAAAPPKPVTGPTLGEVAYRAWAASKPLAFSVHWDRVPDPEAWEAVGRAVAASVLSAVETSLPSAIRAAVAPLSPRTKT